MLLLLTAEPEPASLIDTITPFIAPALALLGVIVMAVLGAWNRKRGNLETRAPDVNEIWQQQRLDARELDHERHFRRLLEDLAGMWRRTFRGYVDRVRSGGSTELTEYEQRAYDTPFPTADAQPPTDK